MKHIILPLLIFLCAGCSRTPFNTSMKGIGFWQTPEVVEEAFGKKDLRNLKLNLTLVIGDAYGETNEDLELSYVLGMGIPELMRERIEEDYVTLFRKEDVSSLEWNEITKNHAEGSFIYDAFFGRGKIIFKAIKLEGEWMINHMEIPPKEDSSTKDSLPVFSYSEEEIKAILQ